MRVAFVASILTLATTGAACTPAPSAPQAPMAATSAPSASPLLEPAPEGPPVVVPQHLPPAANTIALAPSGRHLALGAQDRVQIVDVATGETRGVLDGCVDDVVFSPDERSVVAACRRTNSVRVWDLATDTAQQLTLGGTPSALVAPPWGHAVLVISAKSIVVLDTPRASLATLENGVVFSDFRTAQASTSGWTVAHEGVDMLSVWGPAGKLVRRVPVRRHSRAFALSEQGKRLAFPGAQGVVIVDPDSGREVAQAKPCADAPVVAMAFGPDEDRLVVACGGPTETSPGRVVVLTADGAEERELMKTSTSTVELAAHGARVAVNPHLDDVVVFELATGHEIHRLRSPTKGGGMPRLARTLDRALYGLGFGFETFRSLVGLADLAVVDHAAGIVGPRLQPKAPPASAVEASAPLHEERAPSTSLVLPKGFDGFELVDLKTGERRRVTAAGARAPGADVTLSDHGAWVVIREPFGPDRTQLSLFDARTGKEGKRFTLDTGSKSIPLMLGWSRDDALFSQLFATTRGRGGKPCKGQPSAPCVGTRVFDARSGRALVTLLPEQPQEPAQFAPDGKHVIFGHEVLDARTGRRAWSLPPGAAVAGSSAAGAMLVRVAGKSIVLDSDTGKTLRELGDVGAWIAGTPDDAVLLAADSGGAVTRWETRTWARHETKLRAAPGRTFVLSPDGARARYLDGNTLVVHRFSDGRSLRRALPGLDFDITDEGVFDPAQGVALVRRGPDVLRSPMAPASLLADRLGHPSLYADFMAGKPVSPKP